MQRFRRVSTSTVKLVKRHTVTPSLPVPAHIIRPTHAPYDNADASVAIRKPSDDIQIKTAEEIQLMRTACELASKMRALAISLAKPGVTTDAIDRAVHAETLAYGAYPSPLGYAGFPKSLCTSVNEVACHGIPDMRPLEDGDVVNFDVSVFANGFHGDCSGMALVGASPAAADAKLVRITNECLQAAIKVCGPGRKFNAIGEVVFEHARLHGFNVVSRFAGHGIGRVFHMPPYVFHVPNRETREMRPGMTFTIEPLLSAGSHDTRLWSDGWTHVTLDNSRTAQVEDTVLITETGVEVLTKHTPSANKSCSGVS